MPYSLDKPDELPANVKKLSDADKAKWVKVFNSTYDECDGDDCEGMAMKAANGAVKKEDSVHPNIVLQLFESALRALGFMGAQPPAARYLDSNKSARYRNT